MKITKALKLPGIAAVLLMFAVLSSPARAEFTYSGNVYPADPATWISGADSYVGFTSDGSLTVSGGSTLSSLHTILGFYSGVTGTAIVTGSGSSWAMGSQLNVGFFGNGALNITNGGAVTTGGAATLGVESGSSGTVTVDGSGSAWTVNSTLSLGTAGTGTVNILNGSSVTTTGITTVGSLGTINFGTNGGTLTTPSLSGSTSQITGTGTLVVKGWTGDLDLVVDGVAPRVQTVTQLTGSSQNVAVKLDISSNSSTSPLSVFTAGYQGAGSLAIKNGQSFYSTTNYVGNLSGSTGTVTVDGSGSIWNVGTLYLGYYGAGTATVSNGGTITGASVFLGYNAGSSGSLTVTGSGSKLTDTGTLYLGYNGNGALAVTNGGTVSNTAAYIAYASGTSGAATVNGGTWTNSGALYVGVNGTGKLSVSAGGAVTASGVAINNSSSILTADVGSSLKSGSTGSGAISNKGTIRLVAGAGAAAGSYKPLSYGTMSGTGTVQALGGVWNSTAHTVTVYDAATTTAGTPVTFNLAGTQRVLVTGAAGKSMGAGFQAGTADLTFSATEIGGGELSALQGLLSTGESVLSGWDFSTTGYTSGSPVYLSLFAGSGLSLENLEIWGYNGSAWSQLSPSDLAYDGTYASFTATSLTSYAVVDPPSSVPIPGAMWLLGSGLVGLVGARRRMGKSPATHTEELRSPR